MTDIVDELRAAVDESTGDLCARAADYIEQLRGLLGAARLGPSFSEVTKDLPRNEPKPVNG